mgnify:CR=1 FL=1
MRLLVSLRLARMTILFGLEADKVIVILNREVRVWFRIYHPIVRWFR